MPNLINLFIFFLSKHDSTTHRYFQRTPQKHRTCSNNLRIFLSVFFYKVNVIFSFSVWTWNFNFSSFEVLIVFRFCFFSHFKSSLVASGQVVKLNYSLNYFIFWISTSILILGFFVSSSYSWSFKFCTKFWRKRTYKFLRSFLSTTLEFYTKI